MLRYVIIFSAHLMMALKVQAQCESPAVGENRIMNEISDQQTFPEGSTVKFKCSTGYIPVRTSASRSITCTGNQWTELRLQCKKKSCGNPGEIVNGKYLFSEGILYGSTIRAQCNEGYQLIGDPERNCRETGWDKRHPVCEVVKCINPPSVPDGVFDPEEEVYNYGDGVYYSCKRGLDLFGPSLLTCSNDGTFQPAPPRCLFVTCERPEILNAFRIEGKSPPYKYRDFLRYQCNKGYEMEGSDFLICKEDGWDPPPPQCTIVTCLPPPLIHNGQFNPQEELYEYGNSVTFTCNEGFKLKGSASSSCTEHGIFQPSAPQCQEIFCDPQTIQNAVIVGHSSLYRYNDLVQIRCNRGYKTVGSDRLTCGVNGWSPGFRPCTVVTCERPEILNAVRVQGKWPPYKYKDIVGYRCNKGYKMEGSDRMICKEDGWDPPPPQCTIVTCLPPPINNGQFNPQEELYEYGNRVTFTCNEGFKRIGSASSSCTEHGIFQPSPPQCEEIFCDPQTIQNAVIVGNSSLYRYNDSVQIRCNRGYKTVGSDRLTCGVNGWSPGFSPCTVVTCLPPILIHHGQFNPQEKLYEYGNSVTFTCNEGFKLNGSASSSCTEHGIFQPSPPQCEEIFCDPQTIQNAVIVGNSSLYRYNDSVQIRFVTYERPEILNGVKVEEKSPPYKYKDIVRYRCNKGYKMEGSDRMTCKEDGWDPPPPQCTIVTCEIPKILNAVRVEGKSPPYKYRDIVRYRCNKGYEMEGSDRMTCKEDGWDPPPPQCMIVTCEIPKILNAVIVEEKSPHEYKDTFRYRCNKGYKMEGSVRMICKEDGWDPPPPQCTIVTCLPPTLIHHGQFNPQEELYEYGNSVTFTCNEGFKLKGSASSSCTEHGIFQPSPPQCEEIFCDPQTIQNAVIVGNSSLYRYNKSVQIRCNRGYKTVGSDRLTCGVNGWSPGFPPCTVGTCERPEILNAVRVQGKSPPYKYRDIVGYRCNKGYKMEGSDRMICKEDGWDPPPPQCTIMTCLPPPINNGQFNPQEELYEYGNRVTFTCNERFKLKGSASSSCTEYGIFQPSPPQCEEIFCDPQTIQNAVIVGISSLYRYNDSVQIRCNRGYKTVGSDRLTCGVNGWSPGFPPCTVVTCEIPEILNAVRVQRKWPPYKYKDIVRYRCNEGYKMEGSDRMICKEDGWDPPPPQCTIVTCLPPPINNGQVNPQEELYEYGNSVTFTCNEGFKLNGSASSSCTEHGIFQPSPPQCEANSCGNPGDITHGKYLTPDGILFGATATAQCDEGYLLVGERTRNCRDAGWDGRAPVCEEVKCDPPPSIQNGSFEPMDEVYNYNQSVTYSCKKNYTLIGASAVFCSDNGTFPPPPRCLIPDAKLIPVLVNVSSSVPPAEQTTPKSMD